MKPQLLDLFNSEHSFDNFITISNKKVSEALKNNNSQFTHICGIKNSGKTHLLKSWVNEACLLHKSTKYINSLDSISENEIRNLATYYQYIAIDNIDSLNEVQQIELFDLFNSIKLSNRDNLLVTSSAFGFENNQNIRNDLKTRILSGLNLHLISPDDNEIMQTLHLYILKEGITIADSELNYMISRYTRNIGILINTIHKIADTAMLEHRNITIPLIKQVIACEYT